MNKPSLLQKYPGLLPFILAIAIFLAINGLFIFTELRDHLQEEYKVHFKQEIALIKQVLHKSIKQNDHANIKAFLTSWGKKQLEIVAIEALTPDGTVVVRYQRPTPAASFMTMNEQVFLNGKPALNLLVQHDLDEVTLAIHKLSLRHGIFSTVFLIILGMLLWWLLRNTAVKPLEQEIEKRLHAEFALNDTLTKLHTSRDNLLKAQEIANLGNWNWDITNDSLEWSDEIFRIFGLQPQQFNATYGAFLRSVHPDDHDRITKAVANALADPTANYRLEHRVIHPDGTERIVEESGQVIRDDSGEPINMLGTVLDITERRVAEKNLASTYEKLKENEARIRAILNNALDAIITIDNEGTIIEFNPAAEELFGYSQTEAIGQNMASLIIPLHLQENHRAALANRTQHHQDMPSFKKRMEFPGLRANGKIIDLEVGLSSILQNGKLTYTGFLQDITDRKQLLISLTETLNVAESASQAKSEFLANMSHEIRSPMNAIMGMTELVLATKLDEYQKENLEIVQNSSNTLLGIINAILDYSKIEAGQLTLERINFDLRGQIEKTCESLAILVHKKELEFHCHIANGIPQLVGDPHRLNQIIINLVNNAIKFTSTGEITVAVAIMADQTDLENRINLHFSVADTGIGIAPDRTEAIFEQFTQVDGSTTRKYGGTGLGLTISKHLVEMFDGKIWVESREGVGSIFHFNICFDLNQRELTPFKQGRFATIQNQKEAQLLAGVKILVGSQHEKGRMIASNMLSRFGAEVTTANDLDAVLDALKLAKNHGQALEVIVLDYGLLPDKFAKHNNCKILNKYKIVLLTTADTRTDILQTKLPFHKISYLKKPIKLYPLLKAINQLTGKETNDEQAYFEAIPLSRNRSTQKNILLVEDMSNNQKLAVSILQQAGHLVTIANDGKEALAMLAANQFDLILMDLHLPNMDGYEATACIRNNRGIGDCDPQIPIIAVTARVLETEEKKCMAAGMNGYLRKPYHSKELLLAIEPFGKNKYPKHKKRRYARKNDATALTPVDIGTETFNKFTSDFLREAPKHLSGLANGLRTRKINATLQDVEQLKNYAAVIGANRMKIRCMRLKGILEIKDWERATTIINELKQDYQDAAAELGRVDIQPETAQALRV